MRIQIFLAALISQAAVAFATSHSEKIPMIKTWQCSAMGITIDFEFDSVLGEVKMSKDEARESALEICRELYRQCRIERCD